MKKIGFFMLAIMGTSLLVSCDNKPTTNPEKPDNPINPNNPPNDDEHEDVDTRTPCEKNGHIGKHYFATNLSSMLSTESKGVNEYWECDNCHKYFLDVSNIEGTWVNSNEVKDYSTFESNDDRLLPLPNEKLDDEFYSLILDANDKTMIKSVDTSLSSIFDIKPTWSEKYGSSLSFKYSVSNEQFEFETKVIDSTSKIEYGSVFTYLYNGLGYNSKVSVSAGKTTLINNIDLVSGWNKLTFDDFNLLKDEKIKFAIKSYLGDEQYKMKITSFYGAKIDYFDFSNAQYIDLNVSELGHIDENNQVKIDIIDNPKVKEITSISFNGYEISKNEFIKTKLFGNKTGEQTLHVTFKSKADITYETDYKVVLCSKLIKSKLDLLLFINIAKGLGTSINQSSDGYFALANDIDFNDEFLGLQSHEDFYGDGNERFLDNLNSGFVGTFDGCGHIIKGLKVSNSRSFIYKLGEKGTIRNIGFIDAEMNSSSGFITSMGEGTIENVYVNYKSASNKSFGTFFNDERTDLVNSNGLNIYNCFVDASRVNANYTNPHIIGYKKEGSINLKSVFSVSPQSLIEGAVVTDNSSFGYFAFSSIDEITYHKHIIDEINLNFTSTLFNRDDVIIPRIYGAKFDASNFIENGNSEYTIYIDDLNEESRKGLTFLLDKIYESTRAKIYVSNNKVNSESLDKTIIIKKDSSINSSQYSLKIENQRVEMFYGSTLVIKNLVLKFLSVVLEYEVFNFDLESFIYNDYDQLKLPTINKVYKATTNHLVNYTYYDKEKLYESGYEKIEDQFVHIKSNDPNQPVGQYHNQFALLSPDIYYSNHRDWYTPNMYSYGGYYNKKKGVDWSYSNLCFNANGNVAELALMQDEFYKQLKVNLLEQKDRNNVCIGIGDDDRDHNSRYCSCLACRSDANANISVIKFLNEMSKRIKADEDFSGRDIYLYTMAYRSLEDAPNVNEVTMDDHVGVWIAPITSNCAYPLNNTTHNAYAYNNIEKWKKLTNNIGFYLYDLNYTRYFAPIYCFKSIVENHKYLSSLGAKFIYYCDDSDNELCPAFGGFKLYLMRKSVLDSTETYESLKEKFFSTSGYYGAAGPRMEYYFDELMKAMEEQGIDDYGDIYYSHSFNTSHLGGLLGSMNYWYQYSILESYELLDKNDSNYETYKKHIMVDGLTIRIANYLVKGNWLNGDSMQQFIADANSCGIYKIQGGTELTSEVIEQHRKNL